MSKAPGKPFGKPGNKLKILPSFEFSTNGQQEEPPKQSPLEKPKSTFKKTGGKQKILFYKASI